MQTTKQDTDVLLDARNLAKHYPVSQGWLKPKATAKALDGVSFQLTRGKTLAVVGESGCGKSTLARQITMIEHPSAGELWMEGVNVASADRANRKKLRPLVQMIFQNPYASLNPRKKVSAMLEEPLIINTDLDKRQREESIREIMGKVGLRNEHYDRYPHMFSGGQRQRIAIARALMLKPKVIVADEPVSALDVSIQAQVLNLLMDLQQSTGVAYLFVSHNLAVVQHIADDVLVMYLGKCVEYADKKSLFSRPLHPYTKALLASTPKIDPAQRQQKLMLPGELPSPLAPPPGCAFHNRCPYANDQCHRESPLLRSIEGRLVACHRVEEIN